MDNIKIGDKLEIHCYKHNGKLHRQWDEAVVLDIKDDYIVFGNNKTTVVDSDGRVWKTKEPAIMFFFKDRWFNIIGQLKDYGIYFYCNIATPYIIDEHVIKYIDYDLDLRVFPDGAFKILDRGEYKYHRAKMEKRELDKEFKDESNPLRVVFVCAMWLTGFDVKCLSCLYLDKPLKAHTLMQTIARANRVNQGKMQWPNYRLYWHSKSASQSSCRLHCKCWRTRWSGPNG